MILLYNEELLFEPFIQYSLGDKSRKLTLIENAARMEEYFQNVNMK